MICIKHFQQDREADPPDWKKAMEFMNSAAVKNVISVSAYPTGPHHNLVITYEERVNKDAEENTGKK